jgi:DNA recombination protein Rad52
MSFSEEAKTALAAPLSRSNVKGRKQGGREVSYIEGWVTIAEANRIFGFDGWTRETVDIKCVSERERTIGDAKKPGWGVSYIAKVRVLAGSDLSIVREGVGAGHGIDVDLGQAHESAIKEAETDAMKRALMTFGNPFGLALYDKSQSNVADEVDESVARFMQECRTAIAGYKIGDTALRDWWASEQQMKARRDFGLTQAQVDELKALVIAKLPAKKAA